MKEITHNDLLHLIETTDYKDLTKSQKEMVLAEMSESEYNLQRKILLRSMAEFDVESSLLKPNPEILERLHSRLEYSKEQPNILHKFINYKIPAYQAVAAILMAFFSAVILLKEPPKTEYVEKKVTVFQPVHDTVYVDRINEVITTKIVTVQQPSIQLKPQQMPDLEMAETQNANKPNIKDLDKTYGNSPMTDKELNQFRVSL